MKEIQFFIESVECQSVAQDEKAAIWGKIYIKICGVAFPDDEWWDVISSMLDMWLVEVVKFSHNTIKHCFLHFMDGPFLVELTKNADDRITVSCKNTDGIELMATVVDFADFIDELIAITLRFLTLCHNEAPSFILSDTGNRIATACRELMAGQSTGSTD